jgi:DNA-binding NarL/FixJ family response regulator
MRSKQGGRRSGRVCPRSYCREARSETVGIRNVLDCGVDVSARIGNVQRRAGGPQAVSAVTRLWSRGPRDRTAAMLAYWLSRHPHKPQSRPGRMPKVGPTSRAVSGREGDILNLIAQGRSDKEIARALSIAPETVKSHVKHIFSKLQVQKRAQAVSRAQSLGLV